ncbi:LysR family transcriptional regulator [Gallaecimonas kandeliae]|uniref:LysR family transcriptional regulator n=1 Tax=Gallaecimonas kandeliae TaxID=3029055 RepID=UPI0026484B9F|nr:LysR family transcriptional regulator [Gallaecimonas kandeliae]WKE66494.1 LysR family transcriptional regulator [Gallaecimonas kandeliae]
MDWDDIRFFLAVAETGQLTAAAAKVGVTQPTMGRRISALEAGLGHKLFQRTPEGFVLTDEGAALLPHARRMEAESHALQRTLEGQAQLSGTLRISSSDWFGVHVLSALAERFIAQHPEVSIELVTESRLLSLARREADLVFRIKAFEEPDIAQRRLLTMEYGLYGAADFDEALLAEPAKLRLVTMDSQFRELPDVLWLERQFPGARVAFASNSREAQARLCAAGIGLAVLPVLLAERLPGLKRLAVAEAPPSRDLWLGYHQDLRQLPRLRVFVALVVAELGGSLP